MHNARKILGYLLSVIAWAIGLIAVVASIFYAASVVMWLHAPILTVLVITLPALLILLGVAWGMNKAGVKLRR